MISSIFTRLCNHHHNLTLEYSHHRKKISHALWQSILFPPFPQLLAITNLFFVSVDLLILDSSHKWNNKICDCLCLTWASLVAQLIKECACSVEDLGSIPGLGRSSGEGRGYPFQYSGLENSLDHIVHRVTKSRTWLSDFHFLSLSIMGFVFVCFLAVPCSL